MKRREAGELLGKQYPSIGARFPFIGKRFTFLYFYHSRTEKKGFLVLEVIFLIGYENLYESSEKMDVCRPFLKHRNLNLISNIDCNRFVFRSNNRSRNGSS